MAEIIKRYDILPSNTFNLDEKGFLMGKIRKTCRVFAKHLFENGSLIGVNEDGNREWITLLAAICADGTWYLHHLSMLVPKAVFVILGLMASILECNTAISEPLPQGGRMISWVMSGSRYSKGGPSRSSRILDTIASSLLMATAVI
jgi:hypothetical protein